MPTQQEFDRYFLGLLCKYDTLRFRTADGNSTAIEKDRLEAVNDDYYLFDVGYFTNLFGRKAFVIASDIVSDLENRFNISDSDVINLSRNVILNLFNQPNDTLII